MRLCLLVTSDAILVKSHQPEHPNINRTKRKPTNILNAMGKASCGLSPINLYKELQATE